MPKELLAMSELECLKLHAFAMHKFVVNQCPVGDIRIRKPERFTQTIELILEEKQRRALRSWQLFCKIHKEFRKKVVDNKKRVYFDILNSWRRRLKRIQSYIFNRDMNTKSLCFITLLNSKIKHQLHIVLQAKLSSRREARTRALFFSKWS